MIIKIFFLLAFQAAVSVVSGITRDTQEKRMIDSCFTHPDKCCFAQGEEEWVQRVRKAGPRCKRDAEGKFPCAIKFGINGWYGSFANVYVAKIFFEEYLGYPVEIEADYDMWDGITLEQDVVVNGSVVEKGQWRRLEDGELDVILEVWPSGHSENKYEYTVEKGSVRDAGALGGLGAIGWYMPSFMLEGKSSKQPNQTDYDPKFLEYWRTLARPDVSELFQNPKKELYCCTSAGNAENAIPCMAAEENGGTPVAHGGLATSADCDANPNTTIPTYGGSFLAGAADWVSQDAQVIKNLGLNFTLEFATTELELVHQIEKSQEEKTPLLFYFYTPHAVFTQYNLTRVMLPTYSQECYQKSTTGGVDCDYPSEILYKVYADRMLKDYPDAAKFVEVMVYSNPKDQESMLAESWFDAASWHTVACHWIKANKQQWSRWLNIIKAQFEDKYWLDEAPKESYAVCPCNEKGQRAIIKIYDSITPKLDVKLNYSGDPCDLGNSFALYSSRWHEVNLSSVVVEYIDCPYVVKTQSHLLVSIAITSIVIIFIELSALHLLRNSKIVRASSVTTLSACSVGAILMNAATIATIGEPNSSSCFLTIAFRILGWFLFFGPLIAKEYVLTKIFNNTRFKSKNYKGVLRFSFVYFTVFALILVGVWAAIASFEPVTRPINVQQSNLDLAGLYETVCPDAGELEIVIIAIVSFMILVSCMWSYQTRNVPGLFSEAKFIMLTNYNLALLGAILGLLQSAMKLETTVSTHIFALAVAYITVSSITLIVGTRIFAAATDATIILQQSTKHRETSGNNVTYAPSTVIPSND